MYASSGLSLRGQRSAPTTYPLNATEGGSSRRMSHFFHTTGNAAIAYTTSSSASQSTCRRRPHVGALGGGGAGGGQGGTIISDPSCDWITMSSISRCRASGSGRKRAGNLKLRALC